MTLAGKVKLMLPHVPELSQYNARGGYKNNFYLSRSRVSDLSNDGCSDMANKRIYFGCFDIDE